MVKRALHRIRVWIWKMQYRPGRVVSRFIAHDIRRDVDVADVSRIDDGIIAGRIRTWNVLYAINGLEEEPSFSDVQELRIAGLWDWTGKLWGGPVPRSSDEDA